MQEAVLGWLWTQGLALALAQGLVWVGWLVGASALALAEAEAAAKGPAVDKRHKVEVRLPGIRYASPK